MNAQDTEFDTMSVLLYRTSRAIEMLASPPSLGNRQLSITEPAEELLLCMWTFRKEPTRWYQDVEPLIQKLLTVKEPHFYDDDERELFEGIVADAKAFLEHRPMENVPRLLRR